MDINPYKRLAQRHNNDAECKRLQDRYKPFGRAILEIQAMLQKPCQVYDATDVDSFMRAFSGMLDQLTLLGADTENYMLKHKLPLDEQPQDSVDL